jgi:iron complex outermembrane receptor protein
MRGQSSPLGTDNTVVLYFADVPVDAKALASGLFDLGSVQLLRGPQGTLFGKNSTGGGVVLTPRIAGLDGVDGYVDLAVGNYSLRQVTAAVNLPIITDKLAVRFSGQTAQRDGTKNLLGPAGNDINYTTGRMSVNYAPSEQFSNVFFGNYYSGRQEMNPAIVTALLTFGPFVPPLANGFAQQQTLGPRTVSQNYKGGTNPDHNDSYVLSNITSYNFNGMTLKNILGYMHTDVLNAYNESSFSFPAVYVTQSQQQKQWTEELQLSGTASNDNLTWIIGGFYSKQTTDLYQQTDAFGAVGTPSVGIDSYKSKALYAQATRTMDRWRFTAGARGSWDSRDANTSRFLPAPNSSTCALVNTAGVPLAPCLLSQTNSDSELSWTLGVDFQATDKVMFYAASRHSYKAAGFNLVSAVPSTIAKYEPEKLTDVEIGLKSTYSIGTMPVRTNLALYWGNYKNIHTQLTGNCNNTGLTSLIFNAQKGTPKGFELEFQAKPSKYLSVSGFYNYTMGKYDEFTLPALPGCVLASAPVLTGQEFGNISRNSGSLSAEVRFPTSETFGQLSSTLNAYTRSRRIGNGIQGWQSALPGYTTLNVRLDLKAIGGSKFAVGAYAKNVTNRLYGLTRNQVGLIGLDTTFYADPRLYGLELHYGF